MTLPLTRPHPGAADPNRPGSAEGPDRGRPDTPSAGPTAHRPPRRAIGFALFALGCLVVGVAAPMPYLTTSLARLAQANNALAEWWTTQPHWVYQALLVHASASGLALVLTPFQLSARVRRRLPRLHQITGRVLVAAIVTGAVPGLAVATHSYAGRMGAAGFGTLAVLWPVTAVQSVRLARRGDLAGHRRWALRLAALTFAAVTLRVGVYLGIGLQAPKTDAAVRAAFDRVYHWMPFGAWVPNLAAMEWWLRRRQPGRGRD